MLLFFPVKLTYWFLNLLGHKVNSKAKVGFSLILVKKLELEEKSFIGHLNFISIDNLNIDKRGYINKGNVIKGPFNIDLKVQGAIGNGNIITRASRTISYGKSTLRLGVLSKITARHRIDCMCDIYFGDYSTLAGSGSQMWTHGYFHEPEGPGRFRIDGKIVIGDNVYIGSNCVFNAGVTVRDKITVGSSSCISKDLKEPGLYVSQPLRYIQTSSDNMRNKLKKVEDDTLIEEVYTKN